ncbi:glycosyltransferase family 32 protein [Gautieria morchelliformis]|nr:glycosyltransferase family 32 protein [Gautieria morchelliformis]
MQRRTGAIYPSSRLRGGQHNRTCRRYPFTSLAHLQDALLRPRALFFILKWLIAIGVVTVLVTALLWEVHVEIMWYTRDWVQKEIVTVPPLAGCFNKQNISSVYNFTSAMGPKHTEVQAGLPLRLGMDCYEFAGTVQPHPDLPRPTHTYFHTYWRVDLAPFSLNQEWLIKSFFATQDITSSTLILWSNGDLSDNSLLQKWIQRYPDAFELKIVDIQDLARGTAMDGSSLLISNDPKAWVDGDLIRLLLLWNYGGVWIDMDSLLTRDLAPLLEHEFITQWDCYDKKYLPFNGALMHFHKHSPYLCEFFHVMATSPPPRSSSTDWGSLLYMKLWRRLVAGGIPPFKILPFCFTDARSCRLDNRLPPPFDPDAPTWAGGLGLKGANSSLQRTLEKVFSVHLHNQWEKKFPPGGWVERYLFNKYDSVLQQ